ncbi:TPA: DUF2190 family protein [Mannheimia haemolytica]|uniref:Uncharacterized conserved protein n=1 Tax=Mannheimia haemolytica TaxID=75985 RepID=A0A378NGR7_MANHA|nr:capsid cement protein [Mannheimia haemolytica]AGQ38329.1 hypothetical protein J450_03955 [Mannheimia haemolytica D171]EPZ02941.1 hypothetical protein L279_07120 [Mannheimia haemolytica D38]KYL06788.1 hypothetical protein AC568_10085 [Mannheimia haemolytica]KYL14916.1 hypothetical protein AC571_09905 [Mannheimia haemolytica]KYL21634.1 hypothetical protein AC574_10085 [Mannheimia haemolytica]
MAKNYIQDGNTVRLTTTKAVTSGDVIVTEDLIAIAVTDAAKNEAVVGLTTGVFSVKAKQADDIKQGAVLYWSEADGATITAGSNKRLGIAWKASGTSSATVDVKINV